MRISGESKFPWTLCQPLPGHRAPREQETCGCMHIPTSTFRPPKKSRPAALDRYRLIQACAVDSRLMQILATHRILSKYH